MMIVWDIMSSDVQGTRTQPEVSHTIEAGRTLPEVLHTAEAGKTYYCLTQ